MLGFRDRVMTLLTSETAKDRAAGATVATLVTLAALGVAAIVATWAVVLIAGLVAVTGAVR